MTAQKPIIHGRDHAPGGADPIPGLLLAGSYTELVLAEPSLLAYWPLSDTGLPCLDVSGNNMHLTDEAQPGHTPTFGEPGPLPGSVYPDAVVFTGTHGTSGGDYKQSVYRPDDLSGALATGTFTVELYAWLNSLDGDFPAETFPNFGIISVGGIQLLVYGSDNTLVGQLDANGVLTGAATFNTGVWVHVACTCDGATTCAYLDAALVASAAVAGGSANSRVEVGGFNQGSFRASWNGALAHVAFYNEALTQTQIAAHVAAPDTVTDDLVLGVTGDGSLGWVQPKVDVTVNGEPPATDAAPPTPADPGAVPPDIVDGLSWIYDQPIVYGGSSFDVEPNTWTTIPFTDVVMVRYSNQTSRGGTCDIEIDPADPSAGGWVDPASPHAITVPHDFPLFADSDQFWDGFSWMQVCLRLETPPVSELTTYRTLRVFETTHQKTVVSAGSWRNTATLEGGWISVFRDPLAAGWTPPADGTDTFAEGDTGGLDIGNHTRIMFAPNHSHFTLNGATWLPKDSLGRRVLTAGMRLVAQVWHDAPDSLTFEAGGTTPSFGSPAHAPYRPHFSVFQQCMRDWGSPWSDWPTYP